MCGRRQGSSSAASESGKKLFKFMCALAKCLCRAHCPLDAELMAPSQRRPLHVQADRTQRKNRLLLVLPSSISSAAPDELRVWPRDKLGNRHKSSGMPFAHIKSIHPPITAYFSTPQYVATRLPAPRGEATSSGELFASSVHKQTQQRGCFVLNWLERSFVAHAGISVSKYWLPASVPFQLLQPLKRS